jgi:small neutral amino acid transporter SnatA (MarC family)
MKTSVLRHVFTVVIAVLAIEMILHGLKGTV